MRYLLFVLAVLSVLSIAGAEEIRYWEPATPGWHPCMKFSSLYPTEVYDKETGTRIQLAGDHWEFAKSDGISESSEADEDRAGKVVPGSYRAGGWDGWNKDAQVQEKHWEQKDDMGNVGFFPWIGHKMFVGFLILCVIIFGGGMTGVLKAGNYQLEQGMYGKQKADFRKWWREALGLDRPNETTAAHVEDELLPVTQSQGWQQGRGQTHVCYWNPEVSAIVTADARCDGRTYRRGNADATE